jgi:hypothetical protein
VTTDVGGDDGVVDTLQSRLKPLALFSERFLGASLLG